MPIKKETTMVNLVKKLDDVLAKVEEVILIAILVIIIGLGFLQVIMRNFFESGFLWADVFLRHLVLWLGLVGASLATKYDKHLNMDALSRVLQPRTVKFISIILNFIASAISVLFTVAGYFFVRDEFEFGEGNSLFFGIPTWVAQIIIPIAFGIIALRFFFKALALAIAFIKKEDSNYPIVRKTGPLVADELGDDEKENNRADGEINT